MVGDFIPLKSVAAPGAVSGLMMGPPDYASMETTNRITANHGTWTADRNGYVRVSIQTTVGGSALCEIDGKRVGREYSGTNTNAQACLTDVYPVGVGDVVKLWVDTSPASDVAYQFIPPVLSVGSSGAANSLVTMGSPDYSAFTQVADLQAPITPNTLIWTADVDCYVDALFDATGLTDSVYIGVEPPGKAKKNIFVGANHQAGERFVYQLQVTEGTKLYTDGGLTARLSRVMLHKIPPLYAPAQQLINYSTTERDTGVKWLNGKTIYQRTFSGKVNLLANTNAQVVSMTTTGGLVTGWGIISRSPTFGITIPTRSVDSSEVAGHFVCDIGISSGDIVCTVRGDIAVNNADYAVTIQYTKSS